MLVTHYFPRYRVISILFAVKPVQDTSCSNESAKAVEKMLENFLKEVTELQRQVY